ncbi:MAG: extracellular solute-binding protein [Clostridia bacterium]|nr:extracellular solute-binding protein [Clostridia bacterium]
MLKFKKGLCLTLAATMLAGCLCACGKKEEESALEFDKSAFSETNGIELPLTEETVKLNLLISSDVEKLEDKVFIKALEALTGLDLNLTLVPNSNYQNRLQMLVASKKLPDIGALRLSTEEIIGLVENDVLVAFDEHLDMLPNYKELFIDDKEAHEIAMSGAVNGHLYFASDYDANRDLNHGFLYRKDIFDKHGIAPWTNTEEFYQALKKLKEIYPESTPLVSKYTIKDMLGYYGSFWDLDLDNNYTLNRQTGEYEFSQTTDRFKDMLVFFRKLYQEGLMDPEFLTSTEASWAAKMTQDGKGFVTFDWIDRVDLFYEQVKASNPDYNLRIGRPIGPNGKYRKLAKTYSSGVFVTNNDKKDYSLKLIDFLLSPAGAKLATLGIEGMTYEIGEDGKAKYLDMGNEVPNITTLENKYGIFNQELAFRFDRASVYFQFSEKLQEGQDMVVNEGLLNDYSYIPNMVKERADEYNDIYANIARESEIFVTNFLMEQTKDADTMWAEWLAVVKDLGVDTLTEIYNQNYRK